VEPLDKNIPRFGFSYYTYVPEELNVSDSDGRLRRRLFVRAWELIPADLKPYSFLVPFFVGSQSGFLGFGGLPRRQIRQEILELSDEYGIPIQPYVRMAFDRYTKEWHSDMEVPLDELEKMFQRHKHLRGIHIGEMAGEAGFFAEERKYLMDAIRLAARYGKEVSFWDHANMWQILLLDEEFIDLIRQHPDTFLPVWETNGAKSEYADQGMPFGLWAGGLVDRWGVNPQAGWYWFEAGYRQVGQGQFMSGWESCAPDTLWGIMSLLGLTAGASTYIFEGSEGWFWNFRGKFGEYGGGEWDPDFGQMKKMDLPEVLDLSETFKKVIHPTLKMIVDHDLIPGRSEVLEKVKVIYQSRWLPDDTTPVWNPEMFRRINWATGQYENLDMLPAFWSLPMKQKHYYMGHLYPATYGLTHGSDLIPNDFKYYWIPVISKYADITAQEKDKIVVGSGDFKTKAAVKEFFASKKIKKDGEGSAWIVKIGPGTYILNTHENEPIEDSYSVAIGADRISGMIPFLTSMTIVEEKDGRSIYLNNFIDKTAKRKMRIVLETNQANPQINIEGRDLESSTDKEENKIILTITFNGPVHIALKERNTTCPV
jgi:hypothetical protein